MPQIQSVVAQVKMKVAKYKKLSYSVCSYYSELNVFSVDSYISNLLSVLTFSTFLKLPPQDVLFQKKLDENRSKSPTENKKLCP